MQPKILTQEEIKQKRKQQNRECYLRKREAEREKEWIRINNYNIKHGGR